MTQQHTRGVARVTAFLLSTTATAWAAADDPPADPIGPLTVQLPLDGLTFTPNAQYKLRFRHFEGRDLTENAAYDFLRHRARIGADLDYDDKVGVSPSIGASSAQIRSSRRRPTSAPCLPAAHSETATSSPATSTSLCFASSRSGSSE